MRTYTPDKTAAYENLVKLEYERQCKERFPDNAMLDMRIVAYYGVPKSASKKKRRAMLSNEIRPTKKPDMHLIKRGVTEEEALKAASHYCKETGGTAYFVYTEEE